MHKVEDDQYVPFPEANDFQQFHIATGTCLK